LNQQQGDLTMAKNILYACLSIFILLNVDTSAMGQTASTGALTGTVKDSSGAVVPNATVTATNLGTDQVRTSTTDAGGTYKFGFLPPGAYKLKFEATGFNTPEVPSVTIIVTETDVLDETLQVGAQTQQVEVHAETEQVQTASSTVGTTVTGNTLSNIPLTTRNYTTVLGLAAGANVGVYNATQLGRGTQDIVVNGANAAQNNYQQDGASLINTAGTGTGADSGNATTGVGIVNPDSIQEFKIQTSTYDAGYGRNAGANVNVVTKSGTNQFHGTGFEFFRNTVLNANDFFRKISPPVNGAPNNGRQVLNQNQFGGTLGGPVKKEKLFFFASFQRTWQKNGIAPAGYSVPTLVGIPQGDRSTATFKAALGAAFCPGGSATPGTTGKTVQGGTQVACNGSNINQVALNILNLKNADGSYYIPGSSTGVNQNVTFSIPAHYFENQGIGNFDYVINSRNTISGRYFYSSIQTNAPIGCSSTAATAGLCVPGAPGTNLFPTEYAVGKLTSILSSNVVNEARVSLQRSVIHNINQFVNPNGSPVSDTQLGITPILPSTFDLSNKFVISGLLQFGAGVNPSDKFNTSWEVADQISWSHGKHTIRAGFEYERDRLNWHFYGLGGSTNASETFTTFQDFLVGLPGCSSSLTAAQCSATQASSTSTPLPGQTNGTFFSNIANTGTAASLTEPGGDIHYYRAPAADAFVQDDFKVSSRLTLNLGLRWEYNGLLYDAAGNATNVWPNLVQTVNVPVAQGGTLGSSAAAGSLAGFVVPSNYNASLYPAPTVGGIFQNNKKVPTQNNPPIDAFAPRAGFAWRPLHTDHFVVRGGAGYFYDRMGMGSINQSSVQIWPYAVPVFQSGTAAFAATEAVPYQPASLGWSPRWININTTNGTGTSSNLNVIVLAPEFKVPTTYQWNLNTQYEFLPRWVLEVGYVGSHSISQIGAPSSNSGSTAVNRQLNEPLLATAGNPVNGVTTNTSSNAVLRVPYLGFSTLGMAELVDAGKTLSDSLQVTVRKQMSYGLEMQTAYTWARVLTTTDHNPYGDPTVQQYGPSSFYRPQRLTISYGWDLPFGHHDGFVGKVADGWNLSGVTVVQDGLPLTIVDTRGGAVYGYNGSTQQSTVQFAAGMSAANVATAGGVESRLTQLGGPGYFNKAAFTTIPTVGAINGVGGATGWGNSGMGIILGPGQFNFDATIQKTTKVGGIHEDASLVFRTEFFNVFNHAQFSTPTGSQLDFSNTQFGQITTSSVNPRLIQFALKYVF
jgi:hypothetical protein